MRSAALLPTPGSPTARAKPPSPTWCSRRQQKLWIEGGTHRAVAGSWEEKGLNLRLLRLRQIGWGQSGGGILPNDFLEQRRHARRRERLWGTGGGSSGRAQALGILLFVHRINAAEDGAGFRIGQMDRAQVPGSVTQPELGQMAEPGRDFKANALQREGAIAAALDAPDLGGKGQLQRFGRGTGLGHMLVVEKALQGSLADLRMDLAVVFQLDPRLAHVVELVQSQVGHPFKHRQEPALDLAPKNLLLAILIRRIYERVFKEHAQPGESLFGFGRNHGRAVIVEQRAGQIALLKSLAQAVAQLASPFGQIPLQMATEPRVVIEDAQQDRIGPLAVGPQHAQGAVMKVQMPESVDVFAFVTADLAGFIAVLGGLGPRTVDRPPALTLEEPVALHPAPQRDVGRQGSGLGLLLHHHRQVVKMELVTPTGMLPVLLGQPLDELGSHRGMLPVVGADLALERLHRP